MYSQSYYCHIQTMLYMYDIYLTLYLLFIVIGMNVVIFVDLFYDIYTLAVSVCMYMYDICVYVDSMSNICPFYAVCKY